MIKAVISQVESFKKDQILELKIIYRLSLYNLITYICEICIFIFLTFRETYTACNVYYETRYLSFIKYSLVDF